MISLHLRGFVARPLAALALAVVALAIPPAFAAEPESRTSPQGSPEQWLNAMNRAFSELNYDGVFSYFTGSDLATLRVVHMVVDGSQRERLVHLNGAPREILREDEDVSCIVMPGDDLIELESSIPSGPFARAFVRRFDQLSDFYGLSFHGYDRVANRRAVRMSVRPKDQDRFGYRLWLDESTKMLLKSELVDGAGKRLEIFQFTALATGDAVDAGALNPALDPTSVDGSMVSHMALAVNQPQPQARAQLRWQVRWVPSGFTMAAADVRRKPSTLKNVNTMMYSDGIAAFSVFIEDMPEAGAGNIESRNGATVAVTHLAQQRPPRLVTVVGELPTATARRIAESVDFVAAAPTESAGP
ncbi:MAG: MucB/RseB C-terminal domain-containing protein [Pseudomonadales bacterium]